MSGPTRYLVCACAILSIAESAQQDVNVSRRVLQNDLTTQRAIAIARERRLAEEREERLFAELEVRDKALRAMAREFGGTREEQAAVRGRLEELIEEKSRLVDAIAQRDRSYAAEVAEFRRQIAGLTDTGNPELSGALQRFADGDRVGAFPVIEQIVRAENVAAERATAIRNAAKLADFGRRRSGTVREPE
ncbi:MAG: hypothetical protein KIT09_04585 [Bryobacteraceae bacterium]|nr:hypothetical protein [Bryobacteraceae bacterium]